jgi:hypothetical protein
MGSTSQPVVTVLRKFLMLSQEQRHGVFIWLRILVDTLLTWKKRTSG